MQCAGVFFTAPELFTVQELCTVPERFTFHYAGILHPGQEGSCFSVRVGSLETSGRDLLSDYEFDNCYFNFFTFLL